MLPPPQSLDLVGKSSMMVVARMRSQTELETGLRSHRDKSFASLPQMSGKHPHAYNMKQSR